MLNNLCTSATLSFDSRMYPEAPTPYFADVLYMLNEAQQNRDFNLLDMVTVSPNINCGTLETVFYDSNEDGEKMLSPIFAITQQDGMG